MGPVAQWLRRSVLAATEVQCFVFFGLVCHGGEFATLVGTVAKRLLITFATGAPEVLVSRFHVDRVWGFLGDGWITHDSFLASS
jgi:hypothetical protein